MRVATYAETAAPTRGSVFELTILLAAILLGTGAVPTIAAFVGEPFPKLITPSWLLLYLGSFFGLMIHQGINWISWLVRYRFLLVLLLLGTIASVSWSINPQMSAERTVHLIGSSLVAIFIGFSIPLLLTLRVFAGVLALIMIASAAAAVGLPALGIEAYEGSLVWKGVFNSKNDLGFWAGAGVLLYITLSSSFDTIAAKLLCWLMAVVCLGALVLSQSATSLVAMLVAGSLALYLYIASRFQLSFFRMAFIAVLFAALTGLIITNIETSELVGRSGDLTGRGEVWNQVIKLIFEHPLKGVGYGSLWFPTDETIWVQQTFFDFTWVVYHAHNGLLHIASEVGIPLSLIAILMVTQQMIEIFYCQYERRHVGVLFVLAFVVAFLVSNYSEARFLVTRELFWIFFLALPISMLRQINVVSPELSDVEIDGEPGAVYSQHGYDVANKEPWSGPLPDEPWPLRPALPAAVSVADMLVHKDDPHHSTSDDLDSTGTYLSLTETDIDLGALVDQVPEDTKSSKTAVPEAPDGNDTSDDLDSTGTYLSLTETDIDLGGLVEEGHDDGQAVAMLAAESQAGDSSSDDFDLTGTNLSLSETDIDLGELVEDMSYEQKSSDISGNVEVGGAEYVPAEPQAPVTKSRQPDTFDNDDTFDIDRYDFSFDLTGDWIDIDLDNSKS